MPVSETRSFVQARPRASYLRDTFGRMACGVLLGCVLATQASVSIAADMSAQTQPAPAAQSTAFGAWEAQCAPAGAVQPGAPNCRAFTSITVQVADGQRAVAAVVVVVRAPDGGVQLSVQLPTSVWLPPGVRVEAADGALVAQFPFAVCSSNVCEAGGVLTAEQWARVLSSTVSLSLRYELQGQQVAKLDFSMSGFADAAASIGLPSA
ncbi:MAG: invasion associated locus B family protein [Pseudomonadota bacterium]